MKTELDFIVNEIKLTKDQLQVFFDQNKYRRLLALTEILCLEVKNECFGQSDCNGANQFAG
jgi:hypothetical protein